MKRKVWIGLLFSALLFLLTCDVFAETGSCGDGLKYNLDRENRSLAISYDGSGSGQMNNYTYSPYMDDCSTAPWGTTFPNSIEIGEGVTSIGNYAFYWCSGLKNITLPSSVTRIGQDAFSCCTQLSSITLPSGLTHLGDNAFYYCHSLVQVELPSTLTSIGRDVFYNCRQLTDVYFDGTEKQWNEVGKDDHWRDYSSDFNLHFRCIVSFDANGHGATEMKKYWENTTVADAEELQADGFVFTGWYKDKACKEKWDFDQDLVSGDLTLYAGWERDKTSDHQTREDDTISAPSDMKTVTPRLLAKMTAKGRNSLVLSWNRTAGAEGYDIFFAKCSSRESRTPFRRVKTIKGNKTFKWTKKGLKKGISYKAYVKAWVTKDGKKQYVVSSPKIHAFTSGGTAKYTNAKSVTVNRKKVTVKKGKTFKLKAAVKKLKKNRKLMPTSHEPVLRYVSTDKKIATVNRSGRIKGVGKGTCYVYAYAQNGVSKKVKVTVS